MKLNNTRDGVYFDPPIENDACTDIWPEADYVPIEVKRGTLVIMHGSLVHKSAPNLSDQPRHAYTLHIVRSISLVPCLQFSDKLYFINRSMDVQCGIRITGCNTLTENASRPCERKINNSPVNSLQFECKEVSFCVVRSLTIFFR